LHSRHPFIQMSAKSQTNTKQAHPKKPKGKPIAALVRGLAVSAAKPITVKSDEKGEMKVSRNVSSERDMLRANLGPNGFRTKIYRVESIVTATTSTAYSTVYNANLATSAEWTTFGGIFDEVRCHDVHATYITAMNSGSSAAMPLGLVVWDALYPSCWTQPVGHQ
jgi:hypothetical protein